MWLFFAAAVAATLYAGLYIWNCARKKKTLAMVGACLLCLLAVGMSTMLLLMGIR